MQSPPGRNLRRRVMVGRSISLLCAAILAVVVTTTLAARQWDQLLRSQRHVQLWYEQERAGKDPGPFVTSDSPWSYSVGLSEEEEAEIESRLRRVGANVAIPQFQVCSRRGQLNLGVIVLVFVSLSCGFLGGAVAACRLAVPRVVWRDVRDSAELGVATAFNRLQIWSGPFIGISVGALAWYVSAPRPGSNGVQSSAWMNVELWAWGLSIAFGAIISALAAGIRVTSVLRSLAARDLLKTESICWRCGYPTASEHTEICTECGTNTTRRTLRSLARECSYVLPIRWSVLAALIVIPTVLIAFAYYTYTDTDQTIRDVASTLRSIKQWMFFVHR